ncbi:MAG: hypothetical protein HRT35_31080 [Algicola sp.]|nr:hypothetical protein [Algicola sp.]
MRLLTFLLIFLSSYTNANANANDDFQLIFNKIMTTCIEKSYPTCKQKLKGTPQTQQFIIDTLKLMALNKDFTGLYSAAYGEKALHEFNEAFKVTTTFINLSEYSLNSASHKRFTFKDVEGNLFVFENTTQGWKLNVDVSLLNIVNKDAKQLVQLSIGAYSSLISMMKSSTSVDEVFKLGGRYFAVAIYNYSGVETKQKLDKIFATKNIDAEKLKQDMHLFYQQQSQ